MRVAAISDIHGNLPALEAVLADIDGEGVDEIVVVGDTAHGPWPAVLVCHSTPTADDPIYTRITPDAEIADILGPVAADVLVIGHTRMQFDRTLASGLRVVNPGSVGMPYEGARGAYWALLGQDVEFRRTEYDVEATVAAIEVMGVPIDARMLDQLVDPPDARSTTEYFESHRGA